MKYSDLFTEKNKKIAIIILAILGIITTVKLCFIYFDSNFNPYALPSFCNINDVIDCDGVARTTFSQFLGIPLACWGLFFYSFVLILIFSNKLKNIKGLGFLEVFKNPLSYICILGYIAFIISMILASISTFVINKICILCVFTYLLNLVIGLIASTNDKSSKYDFIICWQDFKAAIAVKKYLYMFIGVISFASIFLAYTSISYVFTPQVKRQVDIKKYVKMNKDNPFKAYGNVLGDKRGKLKIYLYTDYKCPICQTHNILIHRAASELKNIEIIHKNFPLDMACNPAVKEPFHQNSCMLARYAIAAKKQNRFWELNTEFFERQPKTKQEVMMISDDMGIDTEKLLVDEASEEVTKELNEDIKSGQQLNITGTPVMVINGKIYIGLKPYYELKDILIKAGAKEK
ncbi:MAG: DsbA family protein [bacterium]|nr:DsbA family protein [bacterium]